MGAIFWVAKISNIFWGCLKFLILFWVNGRCWAWAYVWSKNESTNPWVGLGTWFFNLSLLLLPYFVYASSEGNVRPRQCTACLIWFLAARRCDKYQNFAVGLNDSRLIYLLSSADYFQNIVSETLIECQTVWIQIRADVLSALIWAQTVERFSADDKMILNLPLWQCWPSQNGVHWQRYDPSVLKQVPPFRQGLSRHSLISEMFYLWFINQNQKG